MLPRQLFDLLDGFAGRIPLQQYFIDSPARPYRLDQGLPADDE
jgi:hypothetical protein